jgi:hypothetical protein
VTNTSHGIAGGLKFKASGDYGIEDNTCGATLGAGASCTMDIVFTPKAAGERTGELTASSTTAGVGSAAMALDGVGVAAAYIEAAPARLTFPGTPAGFASGSMTVTLTDPGIAAAGGLKAQTTGDFSAGICAANLPAGGSCKMNVIFNPTGQGVRAGQLTITTTAAGAAPVAVSLLGTGTAPPSIVLNPAALGFPATAPGQISAAQTIAIGNPGAAPLDAPKLAITGDFHLTVNTCIGAIKAGGECNVQVDFAPVDIGGRAGTLTVSSATRGVQPAIASLEGIGLTPSVIGVSPPELTFPVVLTGQSSAPQKVTVSNAGGTPIELLNLALSQQFALTANTCKGSLAVGASCTVEVYFVPAAQGAVTGGLTITSASAAVPANVALSGTGGAPAAIVVHPAVVNFPTTGVGTASAPVTVTVTNHGDAASLNGLALKVAAGFRLVKNTCKPVLGRGASCTAGVQFVPSDAGTQQANLAVTTAGLPPAYVTLQGSGFDFKVTLQGVTSQTVASGQTASFDLSIAPLNGSAGSFSFACSTLPANSQCVFNPASETVSAYATGSVIVQVVTGISAAGQVIAPVSSRGVGKWRVFPVALGVLLLPLAWRRRRRALLLVALLAVLAGAVTSCLSASGGAGSEQHPVSPGETPSATYSIPITVLADGVGHKVTVSLTVD